MHLSQDAKFDEIDDLEDELELLKVNAKETTLRCDALSRLNQGMEQEIAYRNLLLHTQVDSHFQYLSNIQLG